MLSALRAAAAVDACDGILSPGGPGLFALAAGALAWWRRRQKASAGIAALLAQHFAPGSLADLTIAQRKFPYRMRADVQKGIESILAEQATIMHFCGVRQEYGHMGIELAACLDFSSHMPAVAVPPQYEDLDIGEAEPMRGLKEGLWFLELAGQRAALLMAPAGYAHMISGMQVELATVNHPEGIRLGSEFLRRLEEQALRSKTYRGKILSLEQQPHSYTGESAGLKVHSLRHVTRDQVILPRATVDLLERNVVAFVKQRPELARRGLSVKKGLLFYGPPGTGKTHTIHYLAHALPEHTTLIISAEQVGLLAEYMTLARLLQPSLVVLEDVDLIARDRASMRDGCEEVLLNRLLNEMDGLKGDAEVLFVLTTNRPESLEAALASRPGRIDQAIEFPLPDEEGRVRLVALYGAGLEIAPETVAGIVRRTERVSAAFIKELMRRAVQFQLERNGTGALSLQDIEQALDEMLFRGGTLNRMLLGAEERIDEAVQQ